VIEPAARLHPSLRCPACRGELSRDSSHAECRSCAARFPAVGRILDLRVPGAAWIDYEEDREKARRLLALGPEATAKDLLEAVFKGRPGWNDRQVAYRTQTFMAATERLRDELDGWLSECLAPDATVLDLGCGGGQFLAVLAERGQRAVGVDVSLEWLVVAERMIGKHPGSVTLVAALAESLPFADASFSGVVSIDVFEHIGDQPAYLREMDRVLAARGFVALSTPNRFSAAAEPHVGVWGVGWLPRRFQKRYVAMRTHIPYEFVRLLSFAEIRRLFRRNTAIDVHVTVAPITPGDVRRMAPRRALLARVYNRLVSLPGARHLFSMIGPFFQVRGRKRSSSTEDRGAPSAR
jgi:ubiquinone/menaquinone biosynthesis C-methylase UbiE